MSLFLFGLNHNTAPVEVRERIAFKEDDCLAALPLLADGSIINEAMILSTCNRVEFLIESAAAEREIENRIGDFIFSIHSTPFEEIAPHLYRLQGASVARHLFRVASSLDSMILGETQIQGQVRQAYKLAAEAGTARKNLHKLLHHAFHTAKRVRTQTEIGGSAVSIASAAIELARKTFGSLEGKNVLIIGAGEMAQAAVRYVKQTNAGQISICNRTLKKAALLAVETGGAVVPFENLANALKQSDVVICSTSASEFLINHETARAAQAVRGEQPTLLVDISVPRNIAPEVRGIENLILADVDDLRMTVATNIESRQREAVRAEAIIAEEVEDFLISLRAMNIGERLGILREKLQGAATAEFAKHRSRLGNLTEEQEIAVQNLLYSTVNKISHPILYGLRRSHEETGAGEFVEILCSLLGEDTPQKHAKDKEIKKQ
ncbi:MAG: glutamyl-tRNA reductase [Acidobacteriota bacterium]|nr:glutamyl-tRNA reductase [Acidobacteriota bacterium]